MKNEVNIRLQISTKLNNDVLSALEKISEATGIRPTRVDFIRDAIAEKVIKSNQNLNQNNDQTTNTNSF